MLFLVQLPLASAYFEIIHFYLHSCIFLASDWSINLIHVSMKLSPGTTFGKWLVSRLYKLCRLKQGLML